MVHKGMAAQGRRVGGQRALAMRAVALAMEPNPMKPIVLPYITGITNLNQDTRLGVKRQKAFRQNTVRSGPGAALRAGAWAGKQRNCGVVALRTDTPVCGW